MLNEIIELCLVEFKKPKIRNKIEQEITIPIIDFLMDKLQIYIAGGMVVVGIIILLMFYNLYVLVKLL